MAEALVEELELERPAFEPRIVQSSAETAECTCPEWYERDHDRD